MSEPDAARVGVHARPAQSRQPAALASQLQGPPRSEPGVHRDGGVRVRAGELEQRHRVRADPGAGGVRQLLLAARRRSRRSAAASSPDEDEKPTPVAVVSHGFWERSLGSDPAIVGKTLTLNRTPFTVDRRRAAAGSPARCSAAVRRCGCRCRCTTSCSRTSRGTSSGAACSCSRSAGWRRASRSSRRSPTCKTVFAQLEQAFPNDNKGRSAGAVPLLEARLNPQGRRRRAASCRSR